MFVRSVAVRLVNRFGLPAVFVKVESAGEINFDTGYRSGGIKTEYNVPKAIRLTKKTSRDILSQIAGNFKTSGDFERYDLRLLTFSVPFAITPSVDYVILDNKKYNIKSVETIDTAQCYILTLLATNEYPGRTYVLNVSHKLKLTQGAIHE